MADQTVTIRLEAEIGQFKNAMGQAAASAKTAAGAIETGYGRATTTAASSADRVAKRWAGTDVGATAAATRVGSAWSGAGEKAAQGAQRVAPWANAGQQAVGNAERAGKAWDSAGTTAGSAASKVAPWATVGNETIGTAGRVGTAWTGAGSSAQNAGHLAGQSMAQAAADSEASASRARGAWSTIGAGVQSSMSAVSGAVTGSMGTVKQSLGEVIAMQEKHKQAWSEISTAAMVGGGAVVAGVGLMVAKYAQFDQAMSNVKSSTHETESNMQLLRQAAMDAGKDTAYSATEAAQGIDELAKAGVSTKDIIGGGLKGALNLAAAGQLDVGEAAETAASAMTQFKLKGSDTEHVADLLAAGAGKAQGSVHDMGAALNQSGLIASQAGLTIEETTGTLAAFASAGLTGSDAGTSFKTMMQKLQNPTKDSRNLLNDLGISMYDSQGNFVGMANVAGQLQSAMQNLTPAQRDAAMAQIFGSDAVRAANVLYAQGKDGIQSWTDKVNDAGYAAETAATKQDNLKGDLEKLGGSIEDLFLKGGSVGNDFLRGAVQAAERFVDFLGQIPGPVIATGSIIAGLAGAAALAAGGFMKTVSFISNFKNALGEAKDMAKSMGTEMPVTTSKITSLAGGFLKVTALGGAAVSIFTQLSNTMSPDAIGGERIARVMDETGKSVSALDNAFKTAAWSNSSGKDSMFAGTIEGVNSVGDAVAKLGNADGIDKFAMSTSRAIGLSDSWNTMADDVGKVDQQLAEMVTSGNMGGAAANFKQIADQAKASGASMEQITPQFSAYGNAISDYAEKLGVHLTDQEKFDAMMGELPPKLTDAAGGADKAAAGIADMGKEAAKAEESMHDVVKALEAMGLAHISTAEAEAKFQESMDGVGQAIKDIKEKYGSLGGVLTAAGDGFNTLTAAGRDAQSAYLDVAKAGLDYAQSLADQNAPQEQIRQSLWDTYNALIRSAGQFGITGQAAQDLARNVMGIPEGKSIETWMDESALNTAQNTKGAVESIPDMKTVGSWMSDEAMKTAIATAAEAAGVPKDVAIRSFMDSVAADKADVTTSKVLGIPSGKSISSWMSENAINTADDLRRAINNVPERKRIDVDYNYNYNYTYRYATIVRDTGIRPNSRGPMRSGYKYGGATGGEVGDVASGRAGRPMRGLASGGAVGMRGFAGGRIPGSRPANALHDDRLARVQDTGEVIGVQSSEFIVKSSATRKNLQLLERLNAGESFGSIVKSALSQGMRGLAKGGQVGSSGMRGFARGGRVTFEDGSSMSRKEYDYIERIYRAGSVKIGPKTWIPSKQFLNERAGPKYGTVHLPNGQAVTWATYSRLSRGDRNYLWAHGVDGFNAYKAQQRRAPAKKAPARRAPAKKAPARKAPAKKATAKKAVSMRDVEPFQVGSVPKPVVTSQLSYGVSSTPMQVPAQTPMLSLIGTATAPGQGLPAGRVTNDIAAAVNAALSGWAPVVQIGNRELVGAMQSADRQMVTR